MWGFHLIIDVGGCNVAKMNSKENIKQCITELVEKTNMKALGEPIFKYFEPTDEIIENKIDGYTVVQIISTSSIVMHFVNSENTIFIDFFSCKNFNEYEIENIILKYFDAKVSKKRFIHRDIICDNET